mgnify:CR=1 FL=1
MSERLHYQAGTAEAFPGSRAERWLESERGITPGTCGRFGVGYDRQKAAIVFPYFNPDGSIHRFKLRDKDGQRYTKGQGVVPYGLPTLDGQARVFVAEGETDALRLAQELGIEEAVLGIPGAASIGCLEAYLPKGVTLYTVFDNDKAGRMATAKAVERYGARPVILPEGVKDVCEYFQAGHTREDFVALVATADREEAEAEADFTSTKLMALSANELKAKFPPLNTQELANTLGLTIKRDETNKVVTFLCQLSAFTENAQLNTSFVAPSSTGKTYIPLEIAAHFTEEAVITVAYCSPTAFFHDVGTFDEKKGGYLVDLSRKILIFLDQPHTLLLQHLRPLLSHDKKELILKITDKSQKAGLRTKNIILRGYPAVIFCTAGLKMDEQESTRFLLLSPETSQEKIREAIYQRIEKEASPDTFAALMDSDPGRQLLKERVLAIRNEHIDEIKVGKPDLVTSRFFGKNKVLKPRHARDIGRILALIKAFALLNLWHRRREGSILVADQADIEQAFALWDEISESQELNLPPYIHNLFKDVILSAYEEKEHGLTRGEIVKKHFEVYGRLIADWQLRQEIIPTLETVGLITQEPDPADKRRLLVYPTTPLTISSGENNSEPHGGVNQEAML